VLTQNLPPVSTFEHADEVRRALLADLGHELGTPLHAITGSLELIDIRLCAPEDQVRLTQARESAKRLDGVLQALLAVAGVDRRAPQVVSRPPSSVVDELVDRWQRRAARRGQLLVGGLVGADDPVLADWALLIAMTDAILDAATQYASGGALNVELVRSVNSVTLSVEDSGPEDSPVRWAAMGRRGIGLAVAQQLANMTPATLTVSSAAAGGIRSEVTLPFG
jgi:signal transduction histidine kinase